MPHHLTPTTTTTTGVPMSYLLSLVLTVGAFAVAYAPPSARHIRRRSGR